MVVHTNSGGGGDGLTTTAAVTRPTEAQLRWAQFRHQRRVAAVQASVERLWLHPESTLAVSGANAEDGNTTDDEDDDDDDSAIDLTDCCPHHRDNVQRWRMMRRRQKPTISRGRRALLRVSQRSYEQRHRDIATHGFRHSSCTDDHSDASEDDEDNQQQHQQQRLPVEGRHSGSLVVHTRLDVRTSTTSTVPPRTKRRHGTPRRADPDRVRRYQEAFQAALASLTVDETVVVAPPRRTWARPTAGTAAAAASGTGMHAVHRDNYTVYGSSTVPKRQAAVHNPVRTPGKAPLDRSATWLVHVPPKARPEHATPNRSFYHHCPNQNNDTTTTSTAEMRQRFHPVAIGGLLSNGKRPNGYPLTPAWRQQVASVARGIFSAERTKGARDRATKSTPPNVSSLPSPAAAASLSSSSSSSVEGDVASFVEHFEQHMAAEVAAAAASSAVHDNNVNDTSTVPDATATQDYATTKVQERVGPVLLGNGSGDRRIVQTVTYDSDDLDESSIEKDGSDDDLFNSLLMDTSFAFHADQDSGPLSAWAPHPSPYDSDGKCFPSMATTLDSHPTRNSGDSTESRGEAAPNRISEDKTERVWHGFPDVIQANESDGSDGIVSPSNAYVSSTTTILSLPVGHLSTSLVESSPSQYCIASTAPDNRITIQTGTERTPVNTVTGGGPSDSADTGLFISSNVFGCLDSGKSPCHASTTRCCKDQATKRNIPITTSAPRNARQIETIGTGCGLSSGRFNHLQSQLLIMDKGAIDFDIRWEKRLML